MRSLRRALLLRLLAPQSALIDRVTYRIRVSHRVRAVWGQGLLVFAGRALRALFRRLSAS
jgi:hypothetical protein